MKVLLLRRAVAYFYASNEEGSIFRCQGSRVKFNYNNLQLKMKTFGRVKLGTLVTY